MASWQSLQSLLIFFGPLLLPRIIGFARSIRASSQRPKRLKPLSPLASHALNILFFSGCVAFLSTLPVFSPANIFKQTHSRLQTSTNVLLNRLSLLRALTATDEKLRLALESGALEARLLYARFGPRVLTHCALTGPSNGDAVTAALICAAPRIAAPHIFHLLALGLATSSTIAGFEASRWRAAATVSGLALGALEFFFVAMYDDSHNARSTKLDQVDFVHWKLRVYRGLAIASMDGALGWAIWLQATGRAFLADVPTGERVGEVLTGLEGAVRRISGLGIIRNGTLRDADSRAKVERYWVREGEVMKDVLEQPEVIRAQRNVLSRIDVRKIETEADAYLDGVLNLHRQSGTAEPVQDTVAG